MDCARDLNECVDVDARGVIEIAAVAMASTS
jgi:hypothetical protein